MTSTLDPLVRTRRPALDVVTAATFVAAAVAFNLGGALHPNDDGTGNKVVQLHDMIQRGVWWPAHAALLASFALFTVALARLRRRADLTDRVHTAVRVMVVVSALTTLAMVPHLLAPLGADSIADGRTHPLSVFMTIDETLADAPWALGIAVLAVVAGVAGDLGNRLTALVGVVGGVGFAAAAVTIPFTDALDGLFPVGGAGITLWALAVALVGWWRRRTPGA